MRSAAAKFSARGSGSEPPPAAHAAQAYESPASVASYQRRNRGAKLIYYRAIETRVLEGLDLEGRSAIDIGTGVGQKALILAERCKFVVASDLAAGMVEAAKRECASTPNVAVVRHDAASLPFRTGAFDLLTCYGLFENVPRLAPFLSEFYRVLRPGGYLVFTCENADAWMKDRSPHVAKSYFTLDAVRRDLVSCGYTEIRHNTTCYSGPLLAASVKLAGLVALEMRVARIIAWLEVMLSQSRMFDRLGQTHLVVAQRN